MDAATAKCFLTKAELSGGAAIFARQHFDSHNVLVGDEVYVPRHSIRQFRGDYDHLLADYDKVGVRNAKTFAISQMQSKGLERGVLNKIADVRRFHICKYKKESTHHQDRLSIRTNAG